MKFDQKAFLISLIEQCPHNTLVALTCNWSALFSEDEFVEMQDQWIASVGDCQSSRQVEVFKSSLFEDFKYRGEKFGQFAVWQHDLNLLITDDRKQEIASRIRGSFVNGDVCHCGIFTLDEHIAKCYDSFMHCWISSSFFGYTESQKERYAENGIWIYFDNEG